MALLASISIKKRPLWTLAEGAQLFKYRLALTWGSILTWDSFSFYQNALSDNFLYSCQSIQSSNCR